MRQGPHGIAQRRAGGVGPPQAQQRPRRRQAKSRLGAQARFGSPQRLRPGALIHKSAGQLAMEPVGKRMPGRRSSLRRKERIDCGTDGSAVAAQQT